MSYYMLLDGQTKNDKTLRVKFSVHQAAIKVSNLGPWTSNELLHAGFSVFGEIERCLVYSDEKGKSKEEGVVEFVKKGVAMEAVRRCNDGCFFLCTSLRPVYAEMITHAEDEDGVPEKALPKHSNEYNLERETGPRFAVPGTFEYEYGTKWKGLYELKKPFPFCSILIFKCSRNSKSWPSFPLKIIFITMLWQCLFRHTIFIFGMCNHLCIDRS